MKKYVLIALIISIVVAAILFFIPINLFEGEIVFNTNGINVPVKAKLSLSYFIGIGAGPEETKDVVDFYLKPLGYFNAFLLLMALPSLISYRIYLLQEKKKVQPK
jgi:hypothetical protein